MSVPAVTITEKDGGIGTLPSGAAPLAVIGVATTGTQDTPQSFSRIQDLTDEYTRGPLVEAAAYHIARGRSVLTVRTGESVAGTLGTLDESGFSGTATPTESGTPDDDFEIVVEFLEDGSVTTSNPDSDITYKESLDGGRTFSGTKVFATTDTEITIADSGGVQFAFGDGDINKGDVLRLRTTAPNWNGTELGTAIDAARQSATVWHEAEIVGPLDGTTFDTVETEFAKMPDRTWIGQARTPDEGEADSAYQTALDGVFGNKANNFGMVVAGSAEITSGVSLRKYRRSPVVAVASLANRVDEDVDLAEIDIGSLSGVSIRDSKGNPKHHDELVNPGLDDLRFTVLRTHEGIQGVYVNNPRIFSAAGSDFEFLQHRRVINLAKRAIRVFFARRLSKSIQVNKSTGKILESEALEIEAGANALLRGTVLAKPKASAASLSLSRDDNLLSTKTLTGQLSIVPLAYPKAINLEIGFTNPALQVTT